MTRFTHISEIPKYQEYDSNQYSESSNDVDKFSVAVKDQVKELKWTIEQSLPSLAQAWSDVVINPLSMRLQDFRFEGSRFLMTRRISTFYFLIGIQVMQLPPRPHTLFTFMLYFPSYSPLPQYCPNILE